MTTFLVWVVTALTCAAAVFGVVALLTGRAVGLVEMPPDAVPPRLPQNGPVRADDVAEVRFDRAFRGYRMDQVDAVLDRLVAELVAREEARVRPRDPADDV